MAKNRLLFILRRSSDAAGHMMESSDRRDPRNMIRIGLDCARMAVGILERHKAEQEPESDPTTP